MVNIQAIPPGGYMPLIFYIVPGLIVLLILITIVWRLASDRVSLPCPAWLSWVVELDNPLFRNDNAHTIIQHLDLGPGMKVLDFGCGPGRLTIPIAQKIGPEGQVTAFDIQEKMLDRNRAKALAANLGNIQYVQGGAGEGKLGSSAYDRALLVTVLGEIPNKDAVVKEIFEALKRGGILSITEVIADPHFQSRSSIRERGSKAGFVEKDFYGNGLSFTINFEKP